MTNECKQYPQYQPVCDAMFLFPPPARPDLVGHGVLLQQKSTTAVVQFLREVEGRVTSQVGLLGQLDQALGPIPPFLSDVDELRILDSVSPEGHDQQRVNQFLRDVLACPVERGAAGRRLIHHGRTRQAARRRSPSSVRILNRRQGERRKQSPQGREDGVRQDPARQFDSLSTNRTKKKIIKEFR